MKRIFSRCVAAVLAVTSPLFSGVSAKAEPATLFNWTGFYIGADAGATVGESKLQLANGAPGIIGKPDSSAFQYGGHIAINSDRTGLLVSKANFGAWTDITASARWP